MKYRLILLFSLTVLTIIYQLISPFPWWSFVIFMFLVGTLFSKKEWMTRSFVVGFLAGMFSWVIPYSYFALTFNGEIMDRIAELFEVNGVVIFLIIALIGGLLGGLSVYAGVEFRRGKRIMKLEIENE